MEKVNVLQPVAEALLALGLSEEVILEELQKSLRRHGILPLKVVYVINFSGVTVFESISNAVCRVFPCIAFCIDGFCVSLQTDWVTPLAEQLYNEKKKHQKVQLPPQAVLLQISMELDNIQKVCQELGRHPLFTGWWRAEEIDDSGVHYVVNIATGEVKKESQLDVRDDVCSVMSWPV